jgi:hypothetical protein
MDLITLAEVKEFLRIAGTPLGSDFDSLIENTIIPSVSQALEGHCNRKFTEQTFVEYQNGGDQLLTVKNPPIISINKIYVDEKWEWAESSLYASTKYVIFNDANIGLKSGKWPYATHSIKIEYTGGYVLTIPNGNTTSILLPKIIRYAALVQSAYAFKRRKDIGLQTVVFPEGSIQKFDVGTILKEVQGYLLSYDLTELAG